MRWRLWRVKLEQADNAVCEAERLRDSAEAQLRQVEKLTPRVDAASSSLQRLRTDNHFGPMIDAILRGSE